MFYDSRHVYLGQAAHCSSDDEGAPNGCGQFAAHPVGTPVQFQGASRPGTVVYNSYVTMRNVEEWKADPSACDYNDFALVRLHSADVKKVNPSVPFWGGPTTSGGASSVPGDKAYTYGNSSMRAGVTALMPKYGVNTSDVQHTIGTTTGWSEPSRWMHYITTVTPGLFGDSGSPVLDARGRPLAVFTFMTPTGASGVVDLAKVLAYTKSRTNQFDTIQLATGTTPFAPLG